MTTNETKQKRKVQTNKKEMKRVNNEYNPRIIGYLHSLVLRSRTRSQPRQSKARDHQYRPTLGGVFERMSLIGTVNKDTSSGFTLPSMEILDEKWPG